MSDRCSMLPFKLIIDLCGGDLATGSYHTYCGVLGMRDVARRARPVCARAQPSRAARLIAAARRHKRHAHL
jgi:hypothetical protein